MFIARRGYIFSNEIRADRKLAMTAVQKYGKLDAGRTAEVEQTGDGGTYRATCKKDVVHQDNMLPGNIEGYRTGCERGPGGGVHRKVVAIETDIELANGYGHAFDLLEEAGQPLGERHAAQQYAHERHVIYAVVLFDDLVRDPGYGAPDIVPIHHLNQTRILRAAVHSDPFGWIITRHNPLPLIAFPAR